LFVGELEEVCADWLVLEGKIAKEFNAFVSS
jgi:hypothetical protein